MYIPYLFLVVLVVFFLVSAIKILNEYERGVIFRLGRVLGAPKGPGLIILIPVIDRMVKVSLRTVVLDIPPQDVITRDNVSIKVNAVVYFRVIEPMKAVIDVENFLYATSQLSQTTLRSVLGQAELDELLSQREKINEKTPGDTGHPHRTVGHQGSQCGGEECGPSSGDAAGYCKTGRGGKGKEGKGDRGGR